MPRSRAARSCATRRPPTARASGCSMSATRNAVEAVYIPEDDRGTLCISSQAGCALDCAFCSTGKQGFNRNLTVGRDHRPAVASPTDAARRRRRRSPWVEHGRHPITNVVMMGMGEPLANFDNVVTAHAHHARRQRLRPVAPARDPVDLGHGAGAGPAARRVSGGAGGVAACAQRRAARSPGADQPQVSARPSCWPHACATSSARRAISSPSNTSCSTTSTTRPSMRASWWRCVRDVPCKLNLIPFNPFPEHRVPHQLAHAHPRVPARAAGRRARHDRPQDARRGHRRRLRAARRPGARTATSAVRLALNPPRCSAEPCHEAITRHPASLSAPRCSPPAPAKLAPARARLRPPARQLPPQPQDGSAPERARSCTPISRPATTSAARWTSRSRSSTRRSSSIPTTRRPTTSTASSTPSWARTRKAEQNFERALALAPNDPEIHHNWGWYLCQHKREREALAQFELAVRNPLYRTPEIALVNAGRCAQAIGDVRAAEGYFRRALVRAAGQRAGELRPRAARVQGRHATTRRAPGCARVMQTTTAAARSALSRHVHRAQARRPPGRALVHLAVAQSLSRSRPRPRRSPRGSCE